MIEKNKKRSALSAGQRLRKNLLRIWTHEQRPRKPLARTSITASATKAGVPPPLTINETQAVVGLLSLRSYSWLSPVGNVSLQVSGWSEYLYDAQYFTASRKASEYGFFDSEKHGSIRDFERHLCHLNRSPNDAS